MPRAKRGTKARARRKKILKAAQGHGRREAHGLQSGAAVRVQGHAARLCGQKAEEAGLQVFMDNENKCGMQVIRHPLRSVCPRIEAENIELNRKSLADMAVNDPAGFGTLIAKVKAAQAQ